MNRRITWFLFVAAIIGLPLGCAREVHDSHLIKTEDVLFARTILSQEAPFLSSDSEQLRTVHRLISEDQLEKAKDLLLQFPDSSTQLEKAEKSCSEAEISIRLGKYRKTPQYLSRCKEYLSGVQGHPRLLGYFYYVSGFLDQMKGDYYESIAEYEKTLSLLSATGPDGDEALFRTLNNLGNVYYRLGNNARASSIHLEVLAGRKMLWGNQHPKIAATLGNLGNTYEAAGNSAIALRYHRAAEKIWRTAPKSFRLQLSYTLNNIGIAYIHLGEYRLAHTYLSEAIEIKEDILGPTSASAASSLIYLARAEIKLGNIAVGQNHIENALAIYQTLDLKDHPQYSFAIDVLGRAFLEQGEANQALRTIQAELERIQLRPNPAVTDLHITESHICLLMQDYACSLEASINSIDHNTGVNGAGSSEAILLLKDAANSNSLLEALRVKAKSLIMMAEEQRSSAVMHRSFETLENLITLSNAGQLGLLTSGLSEQRSNEFDNELADFIQIGIDLSTGASDEQLDRRLFVATDMYLGGHLLSELLSERNEDGSEIPGINGTPLPGSTIPKLSPDDASLTNLDFGGLGGQRSRETNISETFRLLNGLVLPSVEPDQSIVEYVDVRGSVIAFVINSEGVSTHRLGYTESITRKQDELLETLRNHESDRFIELAKALYEDLLGPISELIEEDNLLIVPHDVASGVPFELLLSPQDLAKYPPSPQRGLPYLIRSRGVSYGYSVAQIVHNSEKQKADFEVDFLGIAPVFDQKMDYSTEVASFLARNIPGWRVSQDQLEALPGTELEVLEIASILKKDNLGLNPWGKGSVELFIRDAVSESEFKRLNLSKFRFVHIATHGFADKEDPSRSGILMETKSRTEDDGILHAHEVASLDIDSELVVLSACDSAVEAGLGSEISGLAKSFLYAGSQNVVASIWPSDDVGTRILMRIMYAYMAEGYSVDSALRLAKLDLIEMGGPIANPYYWAGFIHIGAPSGIRRPEA